MSDFLHLTLVLTGGTASCLAITFLTSEVILIINEQKLQRFRQQPNRIQQTVNTETDKLINLINQIGTDEDLKTILNECNKLKNPDIDTKDTREITTLILTRLFTKACDDELRSDIIKRIIDLEIANDSKQFSLQRIEEEKTKEKNGFLQFIERINQRLGGIK